MDKLLELQHTRHVSETTTLVLHRPRVRAAKSILPADHFSIMAVIGFDEEQGLRVLSTGFIVFGFITFVLMFIVGINAPYGRYTDGSW